MSSRSQPFVSVVVPAYNAGATLPSCLAALSGQDYPQNCYEIIVVDDGSHDDTAAVAQAAGVRVIRQVNAGPAAARNTGAAAASGDVIMFTDADCEPTADWITQMAGPFRDPAVDGVKGSYRTRQREVVARLAQSEFEERYDYQQRLPTIDFVDSYSAAFRARTFRAARGFDPAFPYPNHEDVDLSYRLARAGHKLVFNRQAVIYHRHAANWRDYLRLKMRRGYWRMLVVRLHPGKAFRDSYTPQTLKLQVLLVYATTGAAVAASIWPGFVWGVLAGLAVLLISTRPFVLLVRQRDPGVWPWAPLFICARAAAFAVGIVGGIAGMLFFRPALRTHH